MPMAIPAMGTTRRVAVKSPRCCRPCWGGRLERVGATAGISGGGITLQCTTDGVNQPPSDAVRVRHDALHAFIASAGRTVGLPPDKANLLAGLIVDNDLRGVVSHGTRQMATYAQLMRDAKLNPLPDVRVVQENAVSLVVDGDG